jgi:S-layer homology domain
MNLLRLTSVSASLLSFPLTASVLAGISAPAWAAPFPDTENHWANPFISRLVEQDIIAGYPDGTFKPDRSVNRDEFAALVRQAFNEKQERQIASGSVYRDVPEGYWASNAIKEAYEMGFMSGYPNGYFRPNQAVSRTEAIVALIRVLDPPAASPVASANTQKQPNQTTQRQQNQRQRRQLMAPLGFIGFMQPLVAVAQAAPAAVAQQVTQAEPQTKRASEQTPSSVALSNYYTDANNIPQDAVDAVEKATKANIVVNHPNPQRFAPNRALTRGEAAAFIYQSLVSQGKAEPLAGEVESSKYIVTP